MYRINDTFLIKRRTDMALQLVLGGSGAGKSTLVIEDIIRRSMDDVDGNYIFVVPEQYTMSTQRKLVNSHPRKGILNIDVVSFERLAYKVFNEVGGENRPVLDDTGKNLILRKVLEDCQKDLKYYGANINRVGFVSELKSVISSLMACSFAIISLLIKKRFSMPSHTLARSLTSIVTVTVTFLAVLRRMLISLYCIGVKPVNPSNTISLFFITDDLSI